MVPQHSHGIDSDPLLAPRNHPNTVFHVRSHTAPFSLSPTMSLAVSLAVSLTVSFPFPVCLLSFSLS